MALLHTNAGKLTVLVTVTDIICLGLYVSGTSYSSLRPKGYWSFVGSSSAAVVFTTACISVFYNAILIALGLGGGTVILPKSTYFFVCNMVSACFYFGSVVADIIFLASNEFYGLKELKAGCAFGIISAALHVVTAVFIRKGT